MQERIKSASIDEVQRIMSKIDMAVLNDLYVNKILKNYNIGIISKEEKNTLLVQIISEQVESGRQYLEGFSFQNSCTHCHGKGFNVYLELENTTECPGTHDCLPCNGSGLMTKTCLRCQGQTLNEILKKRELIIKHKDSRIPNMSASAEKEFREKCGHYHLINIQRITRKFIEENGHKTFRIFGSDPEGDSPYYFIQKHPCKACEGTGRFVYKNAERSIPCPGCHGKGHTKKHFKTTNKIRSIFLCNHCEGTGRSQDHNPVLNLANNPKIREKLKERNLLK